LIVANTTNPSGPCSPARWMAARAAAMVRLDVDRAAAVLCDVASALHAVTLRCPAMPRLCLRGYWSRSRQPKLR
jgi:hypothetical protein